MKVFLNNNYAFPMGWLNGDGQLDESLRSDESWGEKKILKFCIYNNVYRISTY